MDVRRIVGIAGIWIAILAAGFALTGCDSPPVTVGGVVTVTGGAVATNVNVSVYDATGTTLVASTRTGPDGMYVFQADTVPDGTYLIEFGQTAYDQWWENASGPGTATPVTVTTTDLTEVSPVLESGAVSGTVTEASVGYAGATIEAVEAESTNDHDVVATTTTDAAGSYSLTDLPIGAYRIQVSAPGYATRFYSANPQGDYDPALATIADVRPGTNTPTGNLELSTESTITGTVSAGGNPLADIIVTAVDDATGATISSTLSIPDGSFVLHELNNTSYTLSFVDLGGTYNEASRTAVTPPVNGSLDIGDTALTGIDCDPSYRYGDLAGADLSGANLIGCDLTFADLTGANLTGADLTGANLDHADLHNATVTDTDLTNANLNYPRTGGLVGTPLHLPANWTIQGGYLFGPTAKLTHADLTGYDLSGLDLSDAAMGSTILTNANVQGTDLTDTGFTPAGYSNGVTSGGLVGTPAGLNSDYRLINGYFVGPYANLPGANLSSAYLVGVNLYEANLANADLSVTNLTDTNLNFTNLSGTTLTSAILDNAVARGIVGTPAALPAASWMIVDDYLIGPKINLVSANLVLLDLSGANLFGANLNDATLWGSNFTNVNLNYANLAVAKFNGANLTNARMNTALLTGTDFTDATLTGVSSGDITYSGTGPTLPTDWELVDGYLVGPGADLFNATLTTSDLSGMNISGANLTAADLSNANLYGANLTGANLHSTDMVNADLRYSNLTDTYMQSTDLGNAQLIGNTSTGITGTPIALPTNWHIDVNGHLYYFG